MKRPLHTFVVEGIRTQGRPEIWGGLLLTLAFAALLLWAETGPASALGLPTGFSVILAGIAFGSVALLMYDQKRWVMTALVLFSVFSLRASTEGFTMIDLVFGLYVNLGLVLWFVKEVVIFRRRIVHSRFELTFLSILLLCLVTSTIAGIVHGMELKYGLRELTAFTLFFLYFPVRSVFRTDRDVLHIFLALIVFGLVHAGVSLMTYQERVIQSALTYGVVNARSAMMESFSGVMFCAFSILFATSRTMRVRLMSIGGMSLFAGLLVLSLSRGPIAAAVGGTFMGLLLIFPGRLPRLMVSGLLVLAINIGLVFVFLPGFAESIFENISSRFESVARLAGDKSINSRYDEYATLLDEYIPASPVVGYGFGVSYEYYNRMFSTTYYPYFTHSGYLHAMYKFGIPAGILLLSLFFVPLLRFPFSSVQTWGRNRRILYAIAFSGMIAMMVANLTSNTIAYYPEIMLLALLLALFDYVYDDSDRGVEESEAEAETEPVPVSRLPGVTGGG